MSFSSTVVKHLSPVLIGHEFALLRNPQALQQLEDENLTIKVSSGAAEVTASYVIDEQPMEIGVRLPPEFPLKSVEVKDLKRVGVPENKWRGWLLNVQQTITSRVSARSAIR
jgi:E3 ubiquitin-protein ligase listerin